MSDGVDPQGFERRLSQYLEWMRATHYSELTVETRDAHLRDFFDWCAERGVTRPAEVTQDLLERYQRHLFHRRTASGAPLSPPYQGAFLIAVKMFFKWLINSNHVLYDPAARIRLPRWRRRLPQHVLTIEESEQVLNQPDVSTPKGLRDRAALETLYSTGIRKGELVTLKLYDLDAEGGTLMVRKGKGRKQRMVPIGERALAWIQKYLVESRPELAARSADPDEGYLFLSPSGGPMSINAVYPWVKEYIRAAGIEKKGAVHLFRHTMATLMLEGGADIRYLQEMLGHESLESTQIYTKVSIKRLKEVHAASHPAKLKGEPGELKGEKDGKERTKKTAKSRVTAPRPLHGGGES